MSYQITDDELRSIYANAPVEKERFEVIELSCPWFSQTHYLQYAFPEDVDIVLEDDTTVTARYCPMNSTFSENNEDLIYQRNLTLVEVNDLIASEIDRRDPIAHKGIYPEVTSRLYIMYRDGTVSTLKSAPVKTQLLSVARTEDGAALSTSTSPTNVSTTGEIATVSRVPMLEPYL